MDGCSTFQIAPPAYPRRLRLGFKVLLPAFALLFAQPHLAWAAKKRTNPLCDPATLTQLLTQSNGPFNQKLTVQLFETENGQLWFLGTEKAMNQLDPKAGMVRDTLHALTGRSTDQVIVARAITGSLARMKVTKIANDLDFEGLLVAHVREGNLDSLHDPLSLEIKTLVKFFQAHVEQVIQENPNFRFIELKAGEYVDKATGEVKGIKWWLEDVRRGYKQVEDADGTRTLTLEQVFAADARIKADWAVPALPGSPIKGAYTEASVLYRLGMKAGNNQVRLRSSRNGNDESLPVRATTVALDPVDMAVLLEASHAAPSIPLEQIHQLILQSIKKYQKIDHLKVVKRAFSLLQFWDEIADYNILRGTNFTQEQLSNEILSVLRDPAIMKLGQLKAQAELLKVLEEHRISLPEGRAEAWVQKAREILGTRYKRLDLLIETLDKRIDQVLEAKLEKKPHIGDYVNYVTGKIPYSEGKLSESSVFLTLQPQVAFRTRLERAIARWKVKYPNLRFNHPEDAHMTVQFLGRMTPKGIEGLASETRGVGEGWVFEGGGTHIMGRNNNLLALAYEPTMEVVQTVSHARARAGMFGARPEKRFRAYRPHITIGSFDVSNPVARAEAQRFLLESMAEFESVSTHGMDVWTRIEGAAEGQPVYRPYR